MRMLRVALILGLMVAAEAGCSEESGAQYPVAGATGGGSELPMAGHHEGSGGGAAGEPQPAGDGGMQTMDPTGGDDGVGGSADDAVWAWDPFGDGAQGGIAPGPLPSSVFESQLDCAVSIALIEMRGQMHQTWFEWDGIGSTNISSGRLETIGGASPRDRERLYIRTLALHWTGQLQYGTAVDLTGGTLSFYGPERMTHISYCIAAGRLWVLPEDMQPRFDEGIMFRFSVTALRRGEDCDGDVLEGYIDGCWWRSNRHLP